MWGGEEGQERLQENNPFLNLPIPESTVHHLWLLKPSLLPQQSVFEPLQILRKMVAKGSSEVDVRMSREVAVGVLLHHTYRHTWCMSCLLAI